MRLRTGDALDARIIERLRGFGFLEPDERVELLWDETVLGWAKTGVLVTDRRLMRFDKSDAQSVRFGDVVDLAITADPMRALLFRVAASLRDGSSWEKYLTGPNEAIVTLEEKLRGLVGVGVKFHGQLESSARVQEASRERRIQRGAPDFILSTTPTLDGRTIREYRGVVLSECVLGANILRDFLAGVSDVVGGRVSVYEEEFADARETAFAQMVDSAKSLGANAVVGISVDYETVGRMLIVCVRGTAVWVE